MVRGLVVIAKDGSSIQLDNLKPVEKFEQLNLINKYGFNLSWYSFGENTHVILKHVQNGEMQIFLAEKVTEAESILNHVIPELVEKFNVRTEDQKEIFKMLKEHGCCYF